jgi:hypothetical protein
MKQCILSIMLHMSGREVTGDTREVTGDTREVTGDTREVTGDTGIEVLPVAARWCLKGSMKSGKA